MFEYTIVLANGTTYKVIAEDILEALNKNTLTASEIVNVFRNGEVEQMPARKSVVVKTEVYPEIALETGCIVTPVGEHTLKEKDSFIVSAIPSSGWMFKRWEVNGSVVSESSSAIFELSEEDTTYRAVFEHI